MAKNLQVVPRRNGWVVKEEGENAELANVETQHKAIRVGKTLAEIRGCELFVYSPTGQLLERLDYTPARAGSR